jgi:hypothetical protein
VWFGSRCVSCAVLFAPVVRDWGKTRAVRWYIKVRSVSVDVKQSDWKRRKEKNSSRALLRLRRSTEGVEAAAVGSLTDLGAIHETTPRNIKLAAFCCVRPSSPLLFWRRANVIESQQQQKQRQLSWHSATVKRPTWL